MKLKQFSKILKKDLTKLPSLSQKEILRFCMDLTPGYDIFMLIPPAKIQFH